MIMRSGEGSTMRNYTVMYSPNTVSMIKSKRLKWAGHVSRRQKEGVLGRS
jgi:hypothetical protein